MQTPGRDPSMEDILASIKKVIAEEKEMRTAPPPGDGAGADSAAAEDDVLELDEPLAPPADLGPPLLDEGAAGETRKSFDELTTVAATIPPPPATNPLEDMIRDMLKPILKQWVDEHLPQIVNDQVRREISRITGRQL
ncbi:MAG: DUF2497 domain-containing protein [Pseudomonadota bacterium]|nr:DUF2497 domain-containing protein [Pseudomonadota bacterium]